MPTASSGDALAGPWNQLPRADRLRIRRLVRLGRPVDPEEAPLAAAYASHQMTRPWIRFFWLWFVPGIVLALGTAAQIHPVVIGIVLALAAQAVYGWFNLRRTAGGRGG